MAFWRRGSTSTRLTPQKTVTAAARTIEENPEKQAESWFKRREEWQARAWQMYDDVGEAHFVGRFMGDAFSRIDPYVGVQPDPRSPPQPLDLDGDRTLGDHSYTAQEAELANEQLDRLRGPLGGKAEIMRRLGVNLFVPGECYLVGQPLPENSERWDVYSIDEFVIDKDSKRTNALGVTVPTFKLKGPGTATTKELPVDTTAIRIWRSHPRFTEWADSSMKAALPILEELLILTKAIQGSALSRAKGPGVLVCPSSMFEGSSRPQTEGDGQATVSDRVMSDLITGIGTAISDPSSAFAQVPILLRVSDELWKGEDWASKLITWDREIDAVAASQRAELIQRFATAIDFPPEILTGAGSINHWSMWFIGDDTFRSHIEPYVIIADQALTTEYLWRMLRLAGVPDVERFVVWHNASRLVADPDLADKAVKAHGLFLISDDRARRDMNYSDEDAPTDEEVMRRVAIMAASRAQPQMLNGERPPEGASVRAITASARVRIDGLAEKVGQMDANLLRDVQAEADAAMRRALEKANGRLKTLALSDRAAKAAVKDVHPSSLLVAQTLGPVLTAQLLEDEDDLFAGAFLALGVWYEGRLERVTAQTIRLARTQGRLSQAEADQLEAELASERAASWPVLLTGLTSLASALLGRPEAPRPPGETDGRFVPPGTVRTALARAGGGGTQASSMLTGETIDRLWRQSGIAFDGWVWQYGDPSLRMNPFEPHLDLDGVEFDHPDDEALGNPFGWPSDLAYPGDHFGCLCAVLRTGAHAADDLALADIGGEL